MLVQSESGEWARLLVALKKDTQLKMFNFQLTNTYQQKVFNFKHSVLYPSDVVVDYVNRTGSLTVRQPDVDVLRKETQKLKVVKMLLDICNMYYGTKCEKGWIA